MPVPIITYHGVGEHASPLWTPVPAFEAHLEAFARAGYRTVPMANVANSLTHGLRPADDSLVITFDDGYESVYREAWPRLKARGMTATVFLVSDHCGGTNEWRGQKTSVPVSRLVSWSEVGTLAGEGWELGVHTRTHPCLTALVPAAVEDEIAGSQEAIRARTGQDLSVFAYPYGEVNARVREVTRRYFLGAASTRLGLAHSRCDPYRLPRIDAYYLKVAHIPYLRGRMYRGYLSGREAARVVRRRFQQDWAPVPDNP